MWSGEVTVKKCASFCQIVDLHVLAFPNSYLYGNMTAFSHVMAPMNKQRNKINIEGIGDLRLKFLNMPLDIKKTLINIKWLNLISRLVVTSYNTIKMFINECLLNS